MVLRRDGPFSQCSDSVYRSRTDAELKQQEIIHVIVNKKV